MKIKTYMDELKLLNNIANLMRSKLRRFDIVKGKGIVRGGGELYDKTG